MRHTILYIYNKIPRYTHKRWTLFIVAKAGYNQKCPSIGEC